MHTIPSSHISANAGVVQVVHTGRVPWFSGSLICYYVPTFTTQLKGLADPHVWVVQWWYIQGWYKVQWFSASPPTTMCANFFGTISDARRTSNFANITFHIQASTSHSSIPLWEFVHSTMPLLGLRMKCYVGGIHSRPTYTSHSSKLWEIFHSTMNETGLTVIAAFSVASLIRIHMNEVCFCWIQKAWNLAFCCAMYWMLNTSNWIIWQAKCSFQLRCLSSVRLECSFLEECSLSSEI